MIQSKFIFALFLSEDGEGIQLPLCDGKTQSSFQRDDHQSRTVRPDSLCPYAHAHTSTHKILCHCKQFI